MFTAVDNERPGGWRPPWARYQPPRFGKRGKGKIHIRRPPLPPGLKVARIKRLSPSTTPAKVKLPFGPRADEIPEPRGNVVTVPAKPVDIKRLAFEVLASERSRHSLRDVGALLFEGSGGTGDNNGKACNSGSVDQPPGRLGCTWFKAVQVAGCWVGHMLALLNVAARDENAVDRKLDEVCIHASIEIALHADRRAWGHPRAVATVVLD